jgi:hypothetical protein
VRIIRKKNRKITWPKYILSGQNYNKQIHKLRRIRP